MARFLFILGDLDLSRSPILPV